MNPNIFREYNIRGIIGEYLAERTVSTIGSAIGTYFQQNNAKRIIVGFDAQKSSPRFCVLQGED